MTAERHENGSGVADDAKKQTRLVASEVVALAVYSYLGVTIRRILGQIFGRGCHKPGTVGWNESGWMPCTTDPGDSSNTGGAMFVDIPSNILGCFLMGFFISADATLLGVVSVDDIPLAFLPRSNGFQSWSDTHLGLRTGFLGSLTTYASWNTQMVVMICAGKGTVLGTQWVSALFGYLVGWMVALLSYRCGKDLAVAFSRRSNPDLRRKADQLEDHTSMLVQHELPDLLHTSSTNGEHEHDESKHDESKQDEDVDHFQQTNDDIENNGLRKRAFRPFLGIHGMHRQKKKPNAYLTEVKRDAGYDGKYMARENVNTLRWELGVNSTAFFITTALLIWGAIAMSGSDEPSKTYRTYFIAALLSPFGTILRWQLSRLNGKIRNSRWAWLPIGTFAANMIASSISALMQAIMLKIDGQLALAFVGAIQFGFAGCLSTVSTFVVEIESLMKALPQHAFGYYYSLLTVGSAAILGIACYVWATV